MARFEHGRAEELDLEVHAHRARGRDLRAQLDAVSDAEAQQVGGEGDGDEAQVGTARRVARGDVARAGARAGVGDVHAEELNRRRVLNRPLGQGARGGEGLGRRAAPEEQRATSQQEPHRSGVAMSELYEHVRPLRAHAAKACACMRNRESLPPAPLFLPGPEHAETHLGRTRRPSRATSLRITLRSMAGPIFVVIPGHPAARLRIAPPTGAVGRAVGRLHSTNAEAAPSGRPTCGGRGVPRDAGEVAAIRDA